MPRGTHPPRSDGERAIVDAVLEASHGVLVSDREGRVALNRATRRLWGAVSALLERERAVQRAERAAAERAALARDRVLAFVSHDLKSPLNAMMMATTMLERGAEGEARARHLSVLRRAGGRMERLVRDLLDLSSLEAGRLALRPRAVDPAALVTDALAQQAPLAESGGVALAADVPADVPRIRADRDRILQALSSLVSNAIAFTPRGGAVAVRCRADDGALRLEVEDTGGGIAPSVRHLVFDAFWRPQDSHQGTGLGLAIARGIVEAHGGTIAFESEPGRGTTFRLTLPLASPAAGAGRDEAPAAARRPGPEDLPSG